MRFKAASSAVLAAKGQGAGVTVLSPDQKAELRAQALAWLRQTLDGWREEFNTSRVPSKARQDLQRWQRTGNLASVRDPQALEKLPGAERAQWQTLWGDVEAFLKEVK